MCTLTVVSHTPTVAAYLSSDFEEFNSIQEEKLLGQISKIFVPQQMCCRVETTKVPYYAKRYNRYRGGSYRNTSK